MFLVLGTVSVIVFHVFLNAAFIVEKVIVIIFCFALTSEGFNWFVFLFVILLQMSVMPIVF